MNYSVLMAENGILSYRQAPDSKPSGGMDVVRDFLYWQQKLKIISIKAEDLPTFEKFMQTAKSSGEGYEIPYELVQIFKDADGREYARMNDNVVYDSEKGGIYALNHNCSICNETWIEQVGVEKSPLPFCTTCNEAFKSLILKERNKEYGS
jgi:hypothetical protein